MDAEKTYTEPERVIKGQQFKLHVRGKLSEPAVMEMMQLDVLYGDRSLYHEDLEFETATDFDSEFVYDVEWPVPSWPPAGAYRVILKAHGKSESKKDQERNVIMCGEGRFSL